LILIMLMFGLLVLGPRQLHTLLGHVVRAKAQFEEASRGLKVQLAEELDAANQNRETDASSELAGDQWTISGFLVSECEPTGTGDTFWIDEAWLSSQNASLRKSSGAVTQNLQSYEYEKELIEKALAESKGKVAGLNGAAAKLGIPPSTLHLKIKQLKIEKRTLR
jgi:transcriptional regulator with GAF, ATPase, and Fis domain